MDRNPSFTWTATFTWLFAWTCSVLLEGSGVKNHRLPSNSRCKSARGRLTRRPSAATVVTRAIRALSRSSATFRTSPSESVEGIFDSVMSRTYAPGLVAANGSSEVDREEQEHQKRHGDEQRADQCEQATLRLKHRFSFRS